MVTSADGSPPPGSSVRVTATISRDNGQKTLLESDTAISRKDGRVTVMIPVPSNAKCLKINVYVHNYGRQICVY